MSLNMNFSDSFLNVSSDSNTTLHYKDFDLWEIYHYPALIICILGVIGNVLTFIALPRDTARRRVTIVLLQSLALTDSLYLCIKILFYISWIAVIHDNRKPSTKDSWQIVNLIAILFEPMTQILATWMLVPLTLERYVSIRFPFKVPRLCTMRNVRIVIGVQVTSCLIVCLPLMVDTAISQLFLLGMQPSSGLWEFHNSTFMDTYRKYISLIFVYFAPLCIILILNISLVVTMCYLKERRTNRGQLEERRTANILIAIVIVMLVCHMPIVIYYIIWRLHKTPTTPMRFTVYQISRILLVVNSASNFVLYCLIGRRFRKTLKHMICPPSTGASGHSLSSNSSTPI